MKTDSTARLLNSAANRLRLASFARRLRALLLITAGIALAALLCARLLALLPGNWFTPLTLAAAPAAALLAALFFFRKPAADAVARTVDARSGSKELFLTAAMIQQSPGDYRGIVLEQADARAGALSAARLLPFRWLPGVRDVVVAFAVLAACVLWLPQFDPFRVGEQRQQIVQQEQRLVETKKITALRKEELAEKGAVLDEQVKQALAKLDKTLKEMKPVERELNAKKLNEETQDFSELWKKANAEIPKNALEKFEKAAQQFGDADQKQAMKELLEKLKKGDGEGLKQAMEKLKQQMQEIAKMPEGAEKKEQLDKLAKELAKTANQLREQLGDKQLSDALARAAEQLDMAKGKDLAKDALDAANESLGLSQKELERMAEMFKDMENIEDAMKNLAKAKQLNDQGKLDGKDAEGAKSQQDYEELFNKLMAEAGQQGQGQGNQPGQGKAGEKPGIGNGGSVGEDPSAKTALKDEKDKNKMGAGKLLMQWKEEGVGETGQKSNDYQAAVRALKQGVSEAIRNEQVPPGYHGTIQKYFDKLPEKPAAK